MKLFLDAGNSRIKWQLRSDGQLLCSGAGEMESDALFQAVDASCWQQLQSVSVCTVRSEAARHALEKVLAQHTRAPVRFFWTQARFEGLVCAYSQPESMGADRWYAMVAAWQMIRGACVVVDAGSAITADWITDGGEHQGGYILPGRNLMLDSLSLKTARVSFDQGQRSESLMPGRSTAECVFHGVNWLVVALARQLGKDAVAPVVVTGGDGAAIKEVMEQEVAAGVPVHYCPDLVLDGLSLAEASLCAG